MKISSKRQVSIPKKIMAALNLKPGDEVEFQVEGDKARIIPRNQNDGSSYYETMVKRL